MPEELKDLIEKIQEEGVRAGETKAKNIEEEASRRAKDIVEKAQATARDLVARAKDNIARMEKSGKESIKQAGRDLLLSLRKEINAMLDGIIVSEAEKALTVEELVKIITELIRNSEEEEKKDIIISLKEEDRKKLERGLLKELKEETKKGITLKTSDDIRAGFIISYDKGKSHYDFSDKALAEYISAYLKPRLSDMLNGKDSGNKKAKK